MAEKTQSQDERLLYPRKKRVWNIIGKIADVIGILGFLGISVKSVLEFVSRNYEQGIIWGISLLVGVGIYSYLFTYKNSSVFGHIRNKGLFQFIIGAILIFTLLLSNIVQFIPYSNSLIQAAYFPTKTPTLKSTLTNSANPSSTKRPTFAYTPSPTFTPSITPTITPTLTPSFLSEEFSNSCIPDIWKIYPSYMMQYMQITPEPCPNYESVGLSGLNPGLLFFARPSIDQMTSGIYRKLPEGNFVIQVRFSGLALTPPKNGRASFYIFFFNSKDSNGERTISEIENSFYFTNTNPDELPFLMYEKTPFAYSIESSDDIMLTCEKQSLSVKCDIIGIETISTPQEIIFDPSWDSILVGYYSDQNGYVKVNISHFQIIPK